MNPIRKKIKNNPLIKFLSSIKITVICLVLLFILTFWGTVAQVDQGLYLSQQKFFNSWYFLALGFLPIPGAQLVLWVLFVNLLCVSITRFVYKWSHIGITIIHIGLLTYFIAAFVTLHCVEESNITLMEGDSGNLASSYHDWEISLWEAKPGNAKQVSAYDSNGFAKGTEITFSDHGLTMTVDRYFRNASAYTTSAQDEDKTFKNDSGIKSIVKKAFDIEPEKNIPGLIINTHSKSDQKYTLLLYGGESRPTQIDLNGKPYNIQLRRKRFELPFIMTLNKFTKEMHPGTEIASKYESLVSIQHDNIEREHLIYMNHPLRFKDYTFYQASYGIDQLGRELSTLAVVKNSGRLLPYISSFLTFAGLMIHFLMMGLRKR